MKHRFIFLFFLIVLTSCYQVERNCSDFKTGLFYSEVIINDKIFTSTFSRTDSIQVEFYNGKVDSTQIRWINDCEVVYKTINPKNMAERKDVHLKILKTTDSSYTFEYSYVGENFKQKGIAYRKK
ncbi:DNA topoisomerase IV [Olleya aquimaris]|uniref:DNA topoisomerase IV n=1 Tax=Olleya aquimaris TaxID=639310 RepID=A0A327R757_9FLAO|nr:DNA topoisomerase IV [Olleya aquimaris]RAJ11995.1 hypothetical protein LY08_02495 [Olleya aquimaris]